MDLRGRGAVAACAAVAAPSPARAASGSASVRGADGRLRMDFRGGCAAWVAEAAVWVLNWALLLLLLLPPLRMDLSGGWG